MSRKYMTIWISLVSNGCWNKYEQWSFANVAGQGNLQSRRPTVIPTVVAWNSPPVAAVCDRTAKADGELLTFPSLYVAFSRTVTSSAPCEMALSWSASDGLCPGRWLLLVAGAGRAAAALSIAGAANLVTATLRAGLGAISCCCVGAVGCSVGALAAATGLSRGGRCTTYSGKLSPLNGSSVVRRRVGTAIPLGRRLQPSNIKSHGRIFSGSTEHRAFDCDRSQRDARRDHEDVPRVKRRPKRRQLKIRAAPRYSRASKDRFGPALASAPAAITSVGRAPEPTTSARIGSGLLQRISRQQELRYQWQFATCESRLLGFYGGAPLQRCFSHTVTVDRQLKASITSRRGGLSSLGRLGISRRARLVIGRKRD